MIVDDPGQDRIVNELYAWICIDPATGLESIASLVTGLNMLMQAVTSSPAIAEKMGELYEAIGKSVGKRFILVKFTERKTIREINQRRQK